MTSLARPQIDIVHPCIGNLDQDLSWSWLGNRHIASFRHLWPAEARYHYCFHQCLSPFLCLLISDLLFIQSNLLIDSSKHLVKMLTLRNQSLPMLAQKCQTFQKGLLGDLTAFNMHACCAISPTISLISSRGIPACL